MYKDDRAALEQLLGSGTTPTLYEAAALGDAVRVRGQARAEPTALGIRSPDGWPPLHLAAYFGHGDAVDALIEAGADVAGRSDNHEGNTALHAALAGRRAMRIISRLLTSGAEVNARAAGGFTPLHIAAFHDDVRDRRHAARVRRRRRRAGRRRPDAAGDRRGAGPGGRRAAPAGEICHDRRSRWSAPGVTKFGVRKASYRDLIWEAGKACFDSIPAMKPKDLDGLVVGSVMPERTAFQSHISSLAAEALGIRPSTLSARTEHMCASGTVGIRYAYAFIAAGLADLVMVLGVEKLNQPTGDEAILNMGTGVDREWEAAFGLTAPPCFALAAQRHMAEYGTTEEQLAQVGVKNHTHASKNPNAHFNKGATLEQVLCSRMISTPLRLFMCSPITDGAAALVLASEGAPAR